MKFNSTRSRETNGQFNAKHHASCTQKDSKLLCDQRLKPVRININRCLQAPSNLARPPPHALASAKYFLATGAALTAASMNRRQNSSRPSHTPPPASTPRLVRAPDTCAQRQGQRKKTKMTTPQNHPPRPPPRSARNGCDDRA